MFLKACSNMKREASVAGRKCQAGHSTGTGWADKDGHCTAMAVSAHCFSLGWFNALLPVPCVIAAPLIWMGVGGLPCDCVAVACRSCVSWCLAAQRWVDVPTQLDLLTHLLTAQLA